MKAPHRTPNFMTHFHSPLEASCTFIKRDDANIAQTSTRRGRVYGDHQVSRASYCDSNSMLGHFEGRESDEIVAVLTGQLSQRSAVRHGHASRDPPLLNHLVSR